MRNKIIPVFLLLNTLLTAQGPVGSWTDHLSTFSSKNIVFAGDNIYSNTGTVILVYNRQFSQLSKISRTNGLSESSTATIGWSSETESLIIAYNSCNLDIVKNNTVFNIPDIKRKYIPGRKEIYRIKTLGKFAYLATSFGIAVVDLEKREIKDTWKPGPGDENVEVFDIEFDNNHIIAATGSGLWKADMSNPGLSYYGNWNLASPGLKPEGKYTSVLLSEGRIYTNKTGQYFPGDSVFVIGSSISLFSTAEGLFNRSIDRSPDGFTITSPSNVRFFDRNGILYKAIDNYNPGIPEMNHSVFDGTFLWIADNSKGLIRTSNFTEYLQLNLPGPYTNNVINIVSSNGKTWFTGGAVDNAWNNIWRPLQVAVNSGNTWETEISYNIRDAMRVLPDPGNSNHYWVSTWGGGVIEFLNGEIANIYDASNSPLESIIPGKPYSRICGMAMDKSGNIWMTQSGVPGSIKILKSGGGWIVNPLTPEAPTIGDILIASNGFKWIVLPRGYGLFILDDNNTPDNFSDDRHKQMLIRDTDNKVISNVYSIAEDLDGAVWVGTDQGPAVYFNPGQVFEEEPKAFRTKVPRNDGSGLADYLLGTEIITSISVDGANRKWLGTFSSGAYLISADGSEKIVNYTEENSPLLSNTVVSIDVDDKSGQVWFGTSMGIISVRGNSITGDEEFRNVYTFPNPVRESFNGNVTITGLMRNTRVKITDISGNLVYSTISDGGQATWDLKTYNGDRVSTGVYLVFCAGEDGKSSHVTKMLVIK